MLLDGVLHRAVLLKRYKRFLADVRLENGQTTVVHCPNPGSMISCAEPGSFVFLRYSADPARKLPYTWVITQAGDTFVSVDTLLANKLVAEALNERRLPALADYETFKPEFKFGDSRFDFAFWDGGKCEGKPACIMEVKSTTLAEGRCAMFPDARTERGVKHLKGLMDACKQGIRAVQFFCVSRSDIDTFAPAEHIDPAYSKALREAAQAGVEVVAWRVDAIEDNRKFAISLDRSIPVTV